MRNNLITSANSKPILLADGRKMLSAAAVIAIGKAERKVTRTYEKAIGDRRRREEQHSGTETPPRCQGDRRREGRACTRESPRHFSCLAPSPSPPPPPRRKRRRSESGMDAEARDQSCGRENGWREDAEIGREP